MTRPYVRYHMTVSIDQKVTGHFLDHAAVYTEEYYRMHRKYRHDGVQGFICGRATMQSSFAGTAKPDTAKYEGRVCDRADRKAGDFAFYAVCFDTYGSLAWESNTIFDEDPGYDNCHIIEVLSGQVSDAYLLYLQERNISYILAGEDRIDIPLALEKLNALFGIEDILLEGGGIIGGAFEAAGMIDELSFVVSPLIEGDAGRPVFAGLHRETVSFWKTVEMRALEEGYVYRAVRQ
ncbi:MAG: dihydrofolate reductase family protein [Solobacterium sp.]|nr:dihydrofolate reductase family protein [Solobacterium sp.]